VLAVGDGFGGIGEQAGGLDNDVYTVGVPLDIARVSLSMDIDLLAVDNDIFIFSVNRAFEIAIIAVMREQEGICLGVCQIVERDYFDLIGPNPLMPTRTGMSLISFN
jgi:hypothetical protein